jgi:ubiquinone/menaquinone biosynthesis C-methylase UbiE
MHHRRFKHTEAHKLEDPDRLNWLPPSEVVAMLGLKAGMQVADIGAGTGFFAIPIASRILPGGRVSAVDVEPEMLEKLRAKLAQSGAPDNIDLMEGESASTGLPDHTYDTVLLANVWHEIDDRPAALGEAGRILRPGGKIAILDWRPDVDRPPGPQIEHRISPEETVAELEREGWKHDTPQNVGPYSYLVVAERG